MAPQKRICCADEACSGGKDVKMEPDKEEEEKQKKGVQVQTVKDRVQCIKS